ncbi:MAG: hypothetical protein OHK0036_14950 [Bacteroidia bacterium]
MATTQKHRPIIVFGAQGSGKTTFINKKIVPQYSGAKELLYFLDDYDNFLIDKAKEFGGLIISTDGAFPGPFEFESISYYLRTALKHNIPFAIELLDLNYIPDYLLDKCYLIKANSPEDINFIFNRVK